MCESELKRREPLLNVGIGVCKQYLELVRRDISEEFDFSIPQCHQLIINKGNGDAHQDNALAGSTISSFDPPGSVWGWESRLCLLNHYGLKFNGFINNGHGTKWNEIVSMRGTMESVSGFTEPHVNSDTTNGFKSFGIVKKITNLSRERRI